MTGKIYFAQSEEIYFAIDKIREDSHLYEDTAPVTDPHFQLSTTAGAPVPLCSIITFSRMHQMARAASSPVSRLEYEDLAAHYERLTEEVRLLMDRSTS